MCAKVFRWGARPKVPSRSLFPRYTLLGSRSSRVKPAYLSTCPVSSLRKPPPVLDRESVLLDIQKFDPEANCASSATAPASWYIDPRFDALEHHLVWKRNWLHVGHVHELSQPGSFFTGEIARQPFVIVKDARDGEIKAFYNVCSHHAARVADGAGQCAEFVCPYHGWTYRHDGKLRKTTSMVGIKDFRPKHYGLKPIEVDTYGPLVFIKLTPGSSSDAGADSCPSSSLAAALDPLAEEVEAAGGMDDLVFVRRKEYHLECNWKVFVDNYADGGYHVPYAHAALASNVDMDSYSTDIFENISVQKVVAGTGGGSGSDDRHGDRNQGGREGEKAIHRSRGSLAAPLSRRERSFIDDDDCDKYDECNNDEHETGDETGRLGRGAVYAFCYPNFMLNRYGPWLDTNTVVPTGPRSCTVRFDYFLEESSGLQHDAKYVESALRASDLVQQEDEYLCHSVQGGLESDAYSQGRYVPRFETPMFHFHQRLHKDYVAEI